MRGFNVLNITLLSW